MQTDLVARATASVSFHPVCVFILHSVLTYCQVKEVSAYEKTQAVPGFLRKIVECRPRIVRFVSLGIGETVCKALQCQWAKPKAPREAKTRNKKSTSSSQTSNLFEWKSRPARREKSKAKSPPSNEKSEPSKNLADIRAYMLPFKLTYPQIEPVTTSGTVTETLFFALPSTSGANACSYNVSPFFSSLASMFMLFMNVWCIAGWPIRSNYLQSFMLNFSSSNMVLPMHQIQVTLM